MGADHLQGWIQERRQVRVPEGFSDRVMGAVRVARPSRGGRARVIAALAMAACLCAAVVGHVAIVGAMLLAMPGVAQ
jgi:hypothetical protein